MFLRSHTDYSEAQLGLRTLIWGVVLALQTNLALALLKNDLFLPYLPN